MDARSNYMFIYHRFTPMVHNTGQNEWGRVYLLYQKEYVRQDKWTKEREKFLLENWGGHSSPIEPTEARSPNLSPEQIRSWKGQWLPPSIWACLFNLVFRGGCALHSFTWGRVSEQTGQDLFSYYLFLKCISRAVPCFPIPEQMPEKFTKFHNKRHSI